MEQYLDPLRKKYVAATPEERVRQWFISVLQETFKVPAHLMMSEVGFKFGDKAFRADILVYRRDTSALAVVECKRPDVRLSEEVIRQALRYNSALDVSWIILTNGTETRIYRRGTDSFIPCDHIPDYEEMSSSERGCDAR